MEIHPCVLQDIGPLGLLPKKHDGGKSSKSAVQCSTVQYGLAQCSAVQCSTVECSSVQYSTVQHHTVHCIAVQYSAVMADDFFISTQNW